MRFRLTGALVREHEQFGDGFHIVGFQLTHEPLIGDFFAECDNNSSWRDAGNGVANLTEMLDVLSQRFAFAPMDGEEVTARPGSGE